MPASSSTMEAGTEMVRRPALVFGGPSLWRAELDVSLGLGQRLLYGQDPAREVHVPDPQGCQLADTQPRVGGGEHERPVAGWHRIRQGEDLFFGQEAHGL